MKRSYLYIIPITLSLLAASCNQQTGITTTDTPSLAATEAPTASAAPIGGTETTSSTNPGIAIGEPHPQSLDTAPPTTEPVISGEENNDKPAETVAPGTYEDYSKEALADAQSQNRKIVLFLHASWCHFCQDADKDFKANLDKIPAGVTLFKVDYDSNKTLRTQYAVAHQHTFVQIDSEGAQITKWVGGGIDNLLKYLK